MAFLRSAPESSRINSSLAPTTSAVMSVNSDRSRLTFTVPDVPEPSNPALVLIPVTPLLVTKPAPLVSWLVFVGIVVLVKAFDPNVYSWLVAPDTENVSLLPLLVIPFR